MNLVLLFVFFAAVQNIDNLVLAAAYGLKNVHISFRSNLLIGVLSALATGLALLASSVLRWEAVQLGLKPVTEVIGRGVLLMLGIWTLIGCFRSILFRQLGDFKSVEQGRGGFSRPAVVMAAQEAVVVGLALAIDNVAPSFAFGLIDSIRQSPFLSVLSLATLTGVCSIVAVWAGQFMGSKGYGQFQKLRPAILRPELISGLLLIGIAILPLDTDDLSADLLRPQTGQIEK